MANLPVGIRTKILQNCKKLKICFEICESELIQNIVSVRYAYYRVIFIPPFVTVEKPLNSQVRAVQWGCM